MWAPPGLNRGGAPWAWTAQTYAVAAAIFLLSLVLIPRPTYAAPNELHVTRKRGKSPASTHLVLEMPVMRECLDAPGNAIRFYNMSVGMVGKSEFVLNGFFNISRRASDVHEVVLQLTKCRERVSANTCEHFQTWRFSKNVCHLMFNSRSAWTSFNDHVTPRPLCPARLGAYSIQNATIDMTLLKALPMPWEGNVWLVRYYMYEAKSKVHMCTDTEIRVHRVRDD